VFTTFHLAIYISIILAVFIALSLGINLATANSGTTKQRLRAAVSMFGQLTVCSLSYSVFFFVFMLAVGIAVWLLLLGLIYLPADVFNNAFGGGWVENLLNSIKPYVNRSGRSPGLFRQPILDTVTLSTLFFAPFAAALTIVSRHKKRQDKGGDDAVNSFKFRKNSA